MSNELLMIPGPTPVKEEILDVMSQATVSHVDPRFVKSYQNALEYTRRLFSCDGEVFVICGSGTLAMEMAVVNTISPGENLLVLSQGYFGERFAHLARSFHINTDVISAEWGERVDPAQIERQLAAKQYKAVTITHVDTSTGVEADLETLVPLIKKAGALVILDGVCASAGIEENMSRDYGGGAYIDVVLTGSQKAIGVPPGLAIVAFSQAALRARDELGQIAAYYADIHNWLPIMHDPSRYYATPAVNMIWAYEKAMEIIFAEGLEKRYQRHRAYGTAVREALRTYGMQPLAREEVAAATMTCLCYPAGVDDQTFRKLCYERGLVLAGALGQYKGKAFRIGHMGNTTPEQLAQAVRIIGEVVQNLGLSVDTDRAVAILQQHLA